MEGQQRDKTIPLKEILQDECHSNPGGQALDLSVLDLFSLRSTSWAAWKFCKTFSDFWEGAFCVVPAGI